MRTKTLSSLNSGCLEKFGGDKGRVSSVDPLFGSLWEIETLLRFGWMWVEVTEILENMVISPPVFIGMMAASVLEMLEVQPGPRAKLCWKEDRLAVAKGSGNIQCMKIASE